jgi:hypothetical protein
MHILEASALEGLGAANPLTTAKPLARGELVAHQYLVEGRVIADRSRMASPLQSIWLYSFEISEKE